MPCALSNAQPPKSTDLALARTQFAALLFCLAVVATTQGAWLTTLSVYLESRYSSLPASAVASALVALSYLCSVLLVGRSSARCLKYALVLISAGLSLLTVADAIGIALLIIGSGWTRPCVVAQVAAMRPPGMSVSRAFAIYTGLLNAGWMVGGVGADWLRFSLGWVWLFRALVALAVLAAIVCHRLKPVATPQEQRDTPIPMGFVSWALIAAVAVFYLVSGQFIVVLPVVVERECLPLIVGSSLFALKAGTLGGLHGAFVLILTLTQSTRPGSDGSPSMFALGLVTCAATFVLLALAHYPTTPDRIVVAVAMISIGEMFSVAHMLSLGSRLAGFARSAYWLAATAGYVLSAIWSMFWSTWSHRSFFLSLALACIVVAVVMLSASKTPRKRETRCEDE